MNTFIPIYLQDGGTPLFVACQCGHLDVVEGLLDRGANVNAHMKVLIIRITNIDEIY